MVNQNPEQIARDEIDTLLKKAGWAVQDKKKIDFSAALGVAVREYQTDVGPADYALFVDKQAVGVIEAKFEGKNKLVCKSLFSWVNDGSHSVHDDLYVSNGDTTVETYLLIFEEIFEKTGHIAHYEMMMGEDYKDNEA